MYANLELKEKVWTMGTTRLQRLKLLFAIVEVNLFVSFILYTTERVYLKEAERKKDKITMAKKVMTALSVCNVGLKKRSDAVDKKGVGDGDNKGVGDGDKIPSGGNKEKSDKHPILDASNYFGGVASRWFCFKVDKPMIILING